MPNPGRLAALPDPTRRTVELLANVLRIRADELREANCLPTGDPADGVVRLSPAASRCEPHLPEPRRHALNPPAGRNSSFIPGIIFTDRVIAQHNPG